MIFDGKHIDEILDSELDSLVEENTVEGQHLEFKETYIIRDNDDRLEILKDIASLANAGGGYLIIGIREDGYGKAIGYRTHTVEDLNRMKQSIQQLYIEHITERIPRMESKVREPSSNPILVIHIPESDLTPHMIKFNRRTDFWSRYDDGKREMSLPEIRSAFQNDRAQRGLDSISHRLDEISRRLREEERSAPEVTTEPPTSRTKPFFISEFRDGKALTDFMYKKLMEEIKDNPYFWIAATPVSLANNAIDTSSQQILEKIQNPPGSRRSGWNMELSAAIKPIPDGVERGPKNYEYLALYNNAHMEFWTPLGEHFCWRQSREDFEKRPELYPYPVVEFPVTFLRLYKSIIEVSNLTGNFIVNLKYLNLKGYRLRPWAPKQTGYIFADGVTPFPHDDLIVPTIEFNESFDPDVVAHDLLTRMYSAFGLSSERIPFYEKGHFNFPS